MVDQEGALVIVQGGTYVCVCRYVCVGMCVCVHMYVSMYVCNHLVPHPNISPLAVPHPNISPLAHCASSAVAAENCPPAPM